MTVAIYARQSVERKDSVSIETQIEECKVRASRNDNIQVYSDEGFSGKNTERPDLQRLLEDIECGLIKKVIVYKLDRISRNTVDFYNLFEFMKQHGCSFVSLNDGFDTSTAQGRFLMGVLASFAQMERENTVLRVKDSYYFRARTDGRWLGGREPFGFSMGKNAENKSTLIPNEKIKLVEEFYQRYANDANTSLHQLVAYARETFGIKISATQIRNILSNPLYVKADKRLYDYYKLKNVQFVNDVSEFNGTRALQIVNKRDSSNKKVVRNDTSEWVAYLANWQGVVDSRTFITVQERLGQNKAYASSNKSTNKMRELSGLIKCSKCGMGVKMKGKYGSLSCIGRSEYRGLCDASFRGIKLANIQELVADELQNYFDNFNFKVQEEEQAKQQLKKKIEKAKKDLDRLFDIALQSEVLERATLNRIEQKQKELTALELEWSNGVFNTDKIESRILRGPVRLGRSMEVINYRELSTEEKQSLLRIVVDKILLNEDGTIEIVWKD